MKLLVDTHIFLWIILSPKKIPKKIKNILLDPENTKMLSVVTFWEISLKYQLGKLDLKGVFPEALPDVAKETGFEILELDVNTASAFYHLPVLKNKDPFDRMLAWQTISCGCCLLTKDPDFAVYKNFGLKIIQ